MSSQNQLNRIRQAFQIPDSVVILTSSYFRPVAPVTAAKQPTFNIDQAATADRELYKSSLGTPVYADIQFLAGKYGTNTKGVFKTYGPMTFDAVVLTVSQTKKVIKTEIQGSNGTVKEYIGDGDYTVTINGIITGANGHYPVTDVIALKAILDAPTELSVASSYLSNLGIHLLVVDSYEFAQKKGGYSYQTFSITCSSDINAVTSLVPNLNVAFTTTSNLA